MNDFTPSDHTELLALYDAGKALAALRLAEERYGPIAGWRGVTARLLGGRIAMNLGAPQLSESFHVSAYRANRRRPEAILAYARIVAGRRGPIAAIEFLRRARPDFALAKASERAEALSMEATLLAGLRDFDAADALQTEAEAIDPENVWLLVERQDIRLAEDRYDEALEAAEEALRRHPWYRPAIQAVTHLLTLRERDEEALALLTEANQRTESWLIAYPLVTQLVQAERFDEADAALARLVEVTPLLDKEGEQSDMIAGLGAMIAYRRGDRARTLSYLRSQGDDKYALRMAERMETAPPDARRVLLPVPFVRQHHVTCAPATLTAISRFWNHPADHLDIVEKICYDGTPAYSERRWAEDNGWATREFTLDWPTAVALIDRGIPFTLTTRATGMGHLQAVAGYDSVRQTLLLRDPYYRHIREAMMPEMAEQQRAGGPRAMAMVPRDRIALLDGLAFPDADAYDQTFALQDALQRHRREEAWATWQRLAARDGMAEHRLTIEARASIAGYDSDRTEQLTCAERLAAMFPEDANYQLMRLAFLRDLAPRDRRLRALEELCAPLLRSPRESKGDEAESEDEIPTDAGMASTARAKADPVYLRQLAGELRDDARQHPRVMRLLKRARRFNPIDADSLSMEATILWEQRRFDEALTLFRWAYCLDDKDERQAWTYFQAARGHGQTEAALALLKSRFERFAARSSEPAQTLYNALHQIDKTTEAFQYLDRALTLRPDDAELAVFAAERNAEMGRFDQARRLLTGAHGKVASGVALRAGATIAGREGKPAEALALWRQLAESEPLRQDAHQEIARLLGETAGVDELNQHFDAFTKRFPEHFGLHQIWAQSLHDENEAAEVRRNVLNRLIQLNPADGWTRRESALDLCGRRMFREAMDEARVAYNIEPTEPAVYVLRGHICARGARFEEARTAYRQAITFAVDNGYAISELLRLCDNPTQQREALQFVENALATQTTSGEGILAYRTFAARYLPAEEALASLHRLLTQRPDQWQAWSATIEQLIDARRLDDAVTFSQHATARFPLRSQLYLNMASVYENRNDIAAEQAALAKALNLNPYDSDAIHALCDSCERSGETIRGRDLMYQAAIREPLNASNRYQYARLLYKSGNREMALEEMKIAARLRPDFTPLWTTMAEWCKTLNRPEGETISLAREVLARRPSDARLHLTLAVLLPSSEETRAERLRLLDRAIHLNPRLFDAFELRARILASAGDLAGALASCRTAGGGRPSSALQLLAARIEASYGGGPKVGLGRLNTLMASEPDFYDGWEQIARWHQAAGPSSASAYRNAAERMTRLRPQEATSWGYYGQALDWSNDRNGAIAAFRQAFEIQPQYLFAASELMRLLLSVGDVELARTVVATLDRTMTGPWKHVYAIRYYLQINNFPMAVDRLSQLCESEDDDMQQCLRSVERSILAAPGVPAMVAQRLGDRVRENARLNPIAGRIFVRAALETGNRELAERWIAYLQNVGEIGIHATEAYLQFLGSMREKATIDTLLRERAAYLRSSSVTWNAMAFALWMLNDFKGIIAWTADWRGRTDLSASMLLPRAAALRQTNRRVEAVPVAEAGLALPGPETVHNTHAVWLAIEAGIAGQPAAAARYFQHLSEDIESEEKTELFLYYLASAMLRVAESGALQRGAAFGAAKDLVVKAKTAYPTAKNQPLLVEIHGQVIRRIATDVGGPAAQSWALVASRL